MIDKTFLLSASLSNKCSEIMNLFFNYNRILDAGMDYLDIDMGMRKISDFIHKNLAHVAPIDADNFRDFNANNRIRTNYGVAIEANSGSYNSPLEFFLYAFSYSVKILKAIEEAMTLAENEGCREAFKFFESQIDTITKYKYQFALLHDRCETAIDQGNTWIDLDAMWQDFVM